jgi:outer membrane cobalamin receptor
MRHFFFYCLIILCFFTQFNSVALSAPLLFPSDNMDSEEMFLEGDIFVVTAGRRPQKKKESSSTVDIITSEDIQNWGSQTLADALKMLPGMDIQKRGIFSSVSIRGLLGASGRGNCRADCLQAEIRQGV